tara:strand:- start:412 stop:651 length:240 start_codon:yes stop_codon:yes gene_type:complete
MLESNHLKNNGVTYLEHAFFAIPIAIRMLLSSLLLTIHAILPFIKMPESLSILGVSNYLFDRHARSHEKAIKAKNNNET